MSVVLAPPLHLLSVLMKHMLEQLVNLSSETERWTLVARKRDVKLNQVYWLNEIDYFDLYIYKSTDNRGRRDGRGLLFHVHVKRRIASRAHGHFHFFTRLLTLPHRKKNRFSVQFTLLLLALLLLAFRLLNMMTDGNPIEIEQSAFHQYLTPTIFIIINPLGHKWGSSSFLPSLSLSLAVIFYQGWFIFLTWISECRVINHRFSRSSFLRCWRNLLVLPVLVVLDEREREKAIDFRLDMGNILLRKSARFTAHRHYHQHRAIDRSNSFSWWLFSIGNRFSIDLTVSIPWCFSCQTFIRKFLRQADNANEDARVFVCLRVSEEEWVLLRSIACRAPT